MLSWVKGTEAEVAEQFANRIHELARERREPLAIALTGGGSAGTFYDALARKGVPAAVEFYWSDERLVPLDDADSNHKLAQDRLLGPAKIAPERIHPAPTALDPAACARAYAEEIQQKVGGGKATTPRFPLVILGLGTDGHTGSLFPGRDPYEDNDLLVRAVEATPDHPHARITFTPKLMNGAAEVWFVVTGARKNWAVEQLAERKATVVKVPSLAVDPNQTDVTIFRG